MSTRRCGEARSRRRPITDRLAQDRVLVVSARPVARKIRTLGRARPLSVTRCIGFARWKQVLAALPTSESHWTSCAMRCAFRTPSELAGRFDETLDRQALAL